MQTTKTVPGTHTHVIPGGTEIFSLLSAALLVLLIAGGAYRGWSAFGQQSNQLAITQQILDRETRLLSDLTDAETGQRGFLLTGAERYLDPYYHAVATVPSSLAALAQVTAARPDQAQRVERLAPLVRQKLDELRETIEARTRSGPDAALAIVVTGRGKAAMDEIRKICNEIQAVAYARLLEQSRQAQSSANEIAFGSVAGSLALFTLLAASAVTIHRATARRQQLIQHLQDSEERGRLAHDWLQTTIESIGDGVITTDAQGNVTLLNHVAQALTGWSGESALGSPLERVFAIHNEESGQLVESPVSKVLREGRVVGLANHTILLSKDGTAIPIDDSAAPIRDAAGQIAGVVLVFRDVNQRRIAEKLERQNALDLAWLAAIVESSGDAIVGEQLDGTVTSWNPGAERIFGYTKAEMVGQPISTIAFADREDEITLILKRVAGGGQVSQFETTRRRKDGQEIHISLTVSPIRDKHGTVVGASKIARDITERILAEREQHRHAELLARSNADLQQFAYAASHDLREPLRTISVYTQLLQRHLGPQLDESGTSNLHAIISATGRMAHLIDGLLEYSKVSEVGRSSKDPVQGEEVNIEAAIVAALANLKAAIESNHAQITYDPFPAVRGSHLHFVQLFQNLISNALKYRSAEAPRVHVGLKRQGAEWMFSVSDNGQGIEPEYRLQIFDLFKRLHGQDYPGSGIGLATCRKIIERYGGRIWVEPAPSAGSTFFFTVPASEASAAASPYREKLT